MSKKLPANAWSATTSKQPAGLTAGTVGQCEATECVRYEDKLQADRRTHPSSKRPAQLETLKRETKTAWPSLSPPRAITSCPRLFKNARPVPMPAKKKIEQKLKKKEKSCRQQQDIYVRCLYIT